VYAIGQEGAVTTLHVDPVVDSEELCASLYRGALALFTAVSAVSDFVEFTRAQLRELFEPHDPEEAHLHLTPEQIASVLGEWKPRFIHDERSKAHVRAIVREVGLSDALRPAQTSHRVPGRSPHEGHRIRLPVAP
jgi:hypothetical protein